MARRQAILYEDEQLTVVEDYAHHPTEINALIGCLRTKEPDKQLLSSSSRIVTLGRSNLNLILPTLYKLPMPFTSYLFMRRTSPNY